MKPHELFTPYHTFDLTEAHLHILDNPRRLVALTPKTWETTGDRQTNIGGGLMQGFLVTEWEEVLIKNLEA